MQTLTRPANNRHICRSALAVTAGNTSHPLGNPPGGRRDLPRREVVDLSSVNYMSSRAVGVILAHFQALHKTGGGMRVCCARPKVQPVLKQMHLHVLIEIYDTREQALNEPWE